MKYYCGLDVSLKKTAVCVVNQNGDIIRESEVPTEPAAIHDWLSKLGLPMERIGLEAGSLTPWLCHELLALNHPAICIETRHAKAAMQAQQVKTDRNDARGIAHIMRTGWYRAVHVKSPNSQKLRTLLNNRRFLISKRVDIDNEIRGSLKVFGLKTGKVTRTTFDHRIRELIDDDEKLQAFFFPMLAVRQAMIEQARKLDQILLGYAKEDAACCRFMTIPGVGALTALAYKTYVDHPQRFRSSKTVGAAAGLTPRKYASGEVDRNGHITKCGDTLVRSHLYEAAQTMLTRSTKQSSLKAWGLRVARRSSMKKACVAVARRLAVIMHAMWRDGTDFQFCQAEAGAQKCQSGAASQAVAA